MTPSKEHIEAAEFPHENAKFNFKECVDTAISMLDPRSDIDVSRGYLQEMLTHMYDMGFLTAAQREAQAHAAGQREGVEMAAKLFDEKAKELNWQPWWELHMFALAAEIRKLISEGE